MQAGLEAALESGDAGLIAETIVSIMELEVVDRPRLEEIIAGIRAEPSGERRIEQARQVLREALVSPPPEDEADQISSIEFNAMGGNITPASEISSGVALVALMALKPDPGERDRLLAEYRSERFNRDQFTALSAVDTAAAAEAAYFAQPDASHWPELIRTASGAWQKNLLAVAARRGIRMPADPLRRALAQIFPPAGTDRHPVDNETQGYALELLDLSGSSSPQPFEVSNPDFARANAALALGRPTQVLNGLRASANWAKINDSVTDWMEVAARAAMRYPELRSDLLGLAVGVVPSDQVLRHASPLGILGMPVDIPTAESWIRTATSESDALGEAFAIFAAQEQWQRGSTAFCQSPLGTAPFVASRRDEYMDLDDVWREFAQLVPSQQAAAIVTEQLRAQPERLRSRCVSGLIAAQRSSNPHLRDVAVAALAGRADLIETVRALPHGRAINRQLANAPLCLDFVRNFRSDRKRVLGNVDAVIHYSLACGPPPNPHMFSDSPSLRVWLSELLHDRAAAKLTALSTPLALNPGHPSPTLPNLSDLDYQFPVEVWSRLATGRFDQQLLDHYALANPMFRAEQRPSPAAARRYLSYAAKLLLIVGDDPDFARWIVDRTANYNKGHERSLSSAFATFLSAARSAEQSYRLRVAADTAFRTSTPASVDELKIYLSKAHEKIGDEAAEVLQAMCRKRDDGGRRRTVLAWIIGSESCLGSAAADARELATLLRAGGAEARAALLEAELQRGTRATIVGNVGIALLLHLLTWLFLLLLYPRSPAIQATVFWNPWVRKYLGLGYVQFLLLAVPPFTRRLLDPFRSGLTADGQLEGFRRDFYFDDIRGCRYRAAGPLSGRLIDILPAIDGKIWLEAKSGSGKTWFLRDLALRTARPIIFLNATSCVGGVTDALKQRSAGWVAESDFLEQLIYSGRIIVIVDGLNEVAPDIRSAIVVYANRFAGGRILLATQPTRTPRAVTSERVDVLPLEETQIEEFLRGRAPEVLRADDDLIEYDSRVRAFVGNLHRGTPRERDALLQFLSNPMDLRVVADLLAVGEKPDLLNLQEQQIRLVESDYLESNESPFPILAFAEHLYELRRTNKSLTLPSDQWQAEREALRVRRLVLRDDDPGGGERWRFRHDKISDYFLFRAFQARPDRFNEHLADNRFIGVYVLLARNLSHDKARQMLQDIYWAGGQANDFTIGKAFQDALEQKIALQRG